MRSLYLPSISDIFLSPQLQDDVEAALSFWSEQAQNISSDGHECSADVDKMINDLRKKQL